MGEHEWAKPLWVLRGFSNRDQQKLNQASFSSPNTTALFTTHASARTLRVIKKKKTIIVFICLCLVVNFSLVLVMHTKFLFIFSFIWVQYSLSFQIQTVPSAHDAHTLSEAAPSSQNSTVKV